MDLPLATMLVSILWIASEFLLTRLKHSDGSGAQRDRSSLRILWITIACGVTAGIFLSKIRPGHLPFDAQTVESIGLALIVAGLVLRWVAILSLKQHFTVDVSIAKDHRIVRTGLYAAIRHPAYAGTLLSFLGLGIFFMNVLSLAVVFLPITAAFLYRIRIEEAALTEAFGEEYRAYMTGTKRLIPGVY